MIGETIKDFKITGRLGKGGMGEVWVAEQQIIKTRVAIKLLLADVSSDQQHVQRFFNEAIAVSKIKHAGIVKIFDVGFHAGQAFLIMELLEGETLAARIRRSGRLGLGQLADVGRQIASVLEATHAAKITHRDLKPDNIFVVADAELASGERVKILDFGIARLGNTTGMTGTGSSMGTPAYMAPEQWADAGNADARSDVYSVGCVAFEMCCGRPPFVVTTIPEAYAKHANEPAPRARSIVPDLPAELDDIIARALAKQPDERPSMKEIGAVFAAIAANAPRGLDPTLASTGAAQPVAVPVSPNTTLGGAALSASSVGRSPNRPRWWLGAVALVVAGAAGVVIYVITNRGPRVVEVAEPDPALPVKTSVVDAEVTREPANPFVSIALPPSPILLGIDNDAADAAVLGFRPAKKIRSPTEAYALQEHEVTWAELEPWLESQKIVVDFPPWATDLQTRATLPATGMTWSQAFDYCKSIGGTLPTDEQWEFAARGADRRPNSWGADRLDRTLTRAYAGAKAVPAAVKTSRQDRTPPGPGGQRLYDLTGNVQEWTLGLWRSDKPDADEARFESGETTVRGIRGLPLAEDRPATIQSEGAAYRHQFCATGPCIAKGVVLRRHIGFRCAR